tara:strand:- start:24153 stop:24716 length:564 start_codon:yes stop_codon:yes gene_type:complete
MRKIILTSAILLTTAIGASSFALADKASGSDREARHAAMCTDRTAHKIGHLSYLEAKLKPTAEQTKAWNAYSNIVTEQAKAGEKSCLERSALRKTDTKERKRPSIVERQDMMEKRLEAQIAEIKAVKPALADLYASLNDDQKLILDRDHRGGKKFAERRGHKRHGGMDHKARFDRHHNAEKSEITEQ